MAESRLSLKQENHAVISQIWLAGIAAVVASVAANLVLRFLLFAIMDLPEEFPPSAPGAIAVMTTIGVVLAVIVYAITARLSRRPERPYIIIAAAALVVSILPNFGLMANPASAPFPGGTSQSFGLLILFHVMAAIVSVSVLLKMTRKSIKDR